MNKTISTILLAGSIAGVLDISGAFLMFGLRGIPPLRILQGIASGLLGKQAFVGGTGAGLLGGLLHFFIAGSAAVVFYLASRKISFLTRRPIVSGLVFGVFVYAFMNAVVLPLSAVYPKPHMSLSGLAGGLLALMLFLGLPISLMMRRVRPEGVRSPSQLQVFSAGR